MVPIFSVQSYISFNFPRLGIFLDTLRDCYEAYVIYLFLTLLINYLGGENVIVLHLEMQGRVRHPWPWCKVLRPLSGNRKLFRTLRACVLQFAIVKPCLAVVALVLEGFRMYGGGRFDFRQGFLYVAAVGNLSVWTAMYALLLFYMAVKEPLAPFRPLSKFLCIKAVIFCSFWQSLLVAALLQWGFFSPSPSLVHAQNGQGRESGLASSQGGAQGFGGSRAESVKFHDFLICVEMLGFAIAHSYSFSYRDFADPVARHNKPMVSNLQKVLDVHEVWRDAHATFCSAPDVRDVPLQALNTRKSSDFEERGRETQSATRRSSLSPSKPPLGSAKSGGLPESPSGVDGRGGSRLDVGGGGGRLSSTMKGSEGSSFVEDSEGEEEDEGTMEEEERRRLVNRFAA
uniref:Transmembrane protein 184C n=1 Tax=Chromera velia CCMP2878 TaxID=1169474 RepID=A0A0G4G0K2_9ALVE|eukprot:Cvel_19602.t1-p1 / transcript=Cvel_19602.t1 / gene=Cvel_19602 / organism=Chromera_velia_CCMP2878 / gene_product=Transmembrane protein 184 homolog DDB_G0279555, putative / transcript_product=Transmembrane protein 184 homolog DDB_G0279555, putative / location=Cvel_scaffold1704:3362-8104(+) / protein_length=399 / sequence_SO=supercontig / SO=protein_coding / is_pseudo=false